MDSPSFRGFHAQQLDGKLTNGNKSQTQFNSTCRTISVCKLVQLKVNFDGLKFWTALIVGPSSLADETIIVATK